MKHRAARTQKRGALASIVALLALFCSGQAPGAETTLSWLLGSAEKGFFFEKLIIGTKEDEKARVFVECRSYSGGCFEDDDSRRAWPGGEALSGAVFEALWAQAGGSVVKAETLPPWFTAIAEWEGTEVALSPGTAFEPWLVAPEGGSAEASLFYCDGPLRIIVALEGKDGRKAFRASAPCLPLVRLAPKTAAPSGGLEARSAKGGGARPALLGFVLGYYKALKEASPDKALALEDCARRASRTLYEFMKDARAKEPSQAEKAAIALALGSMTGRLYQGLSGAGSALLGVKARELAASLPEEAVLARLLLSFLLSEELAMPYFARENARLAASSPEALPYDYRQYRTLSREEGQRVAKAALLSVVGAQSAGLQGPESGALGNPLAQVLRVLGPEAFETRPEGALVLSVSGPAEASRSIVELAPRSQGSSGRVAHVEAWASPNLSWEEGTTALSYRFRADGSLEARTAAPGLSDGRVDRAVDSGGARGGPGLRFTNPRSIGALALMIVQALAPPKEQRPSWCGSAADELRRLSIPPPRPKHISRGACWLRRVGSTCDHGKGTRAILAPGERVATIWLFLGNSPPTSSPSVCPVASRAQNSSPLKRTGPWRTSLPPTRPPSWTT